MSVAPLRFHMTCISHVVAPDARMFMPTPVTTWSAFRRMANTARIAPTSPPPATASATPSHGLPVRCDPSTPQNAPASIMPSSPMLTTPDLSENAPPIAAKAIGVAILTVAVRLFMLRTTPANPLMPALRLSPASDAAAQGACSQALAQLRTESPVLAP
ncbi:MAG: hypothetical protein BWY85_02206 [Firmicutes bacterium ADurb.Bin506]|nr:MAG: hypothetical protein BWY85_02206 [Firmicutes bacterium ADurb.Bin506]